MKPTLAMCSNSPKAPWGLRCYFFNCRGENSCKSKVPWWSMISLSYTSVTFGIKVHIRHHGLRACYCFSVSQSLYWMHFSFISSFHFSQVSVHTAKCARLKGKCKKKKSRWSNKSSVSVYFTPCWMRRVKLQYLSWRTDVCVFDCSHIEDAGRRSGNRIGVDEAEALYPSTWEWTEVSLRILAWKRIVLHQTEVCEKAPSSHLPHSTT